MQCLFHRSSWRVRRWAPPLLVLLVLVAASGALSTRVAVVNGVPFHEGTYASILHALRSLNITDVTLFRMNAGRGVDDVMAPWFGAGQHGNAVKPYPQFWQSDLCAWDAVIFATSPMDRGHHADTDSAVAERRLAACAPGTRPRIVLVLHNPRALQTPNARSMLAWLRPAAVLTVAPHTAAYTRRALRAAPYGAADGSAVNGSSDGGSGRSNGGSSGGSGGGGSGGSGGGSGGSTKQTSQQLPQIDYFVRVFPFYPPGWDAPNRSGLVIQGKLDATRRNYRRVFRELHAGGVPRGSPALPLTLLGTTSGAGRHVVIPDDLRASGQILTPLLDNNRSSPLPYADYYTALAASAALLPAFAPNLFYDYFSSKSSSTVPVSLISLTPLVADERLLRTYSFLERDAVIMVPRESLAEADAALRRVDYSAVVARLEALRSRMLARNARVFATVLGLRNASLNHAV